jgi:hypothetical protein
LCSCYAVVGHKLAFGCYPWFKRTAAAVVGPQHIFDGVPQCNMSQSPGVNAVTYAVPLLGMCTGLSLPSPLSF